METQHFSLKDYAKRYPERLICRNYSTIIPSETLSTVWSVYIDLVVTPSI